VKGSGLGESCISWEGSRVAPRQGALAKGRGHRAGRQRKRAGRLDTSLGHGRLRSRRDAQIWIAAGYELTRTSTCRRRATSRPHPVANVSTE
jgi:hypothetical protein